MPDNNTNYAEIIDDSESLALFLKKLAAFDSAFCAAMLTGEDFTLRLEIHGNKRKLLHVRTYSDSIERPKSAGANKKS